jgi:predicted glycosyltransferase involved in capsule biosynthesis
MKVSIITAHFNSPEIARRQILHYNKLYLPEDVEVIFIDDGSDPSKDPKTVISDIEKNFKFYLYYTGDTRPWTQPAARNYGARLAEGDYLICTDLDHIISREVIEVARNTHAHVVRFKREVGVLDENGDFTQDADVLLQWGLLEKHLRDRNGKPKLKIGPHGNSYIFKRQLYLDLGGVDERYVGTGKYPNREEVPLKQKLKRLVDRHAIDIIDDDTKPTIYMFPNGRYCGSKNYNPFGLFHNLSRKRNIGRLTNKQRHKLHREKRSVNNNSG